MIEGIKKLIESRNQLAQQACLQYTSLVNQIIASQTKDVNQISHILDCMLDFCFDDTMLLQYRRLCRYLWDIDKETTASYIQAYSDTWDEERVRFGNGKKEK